MTDPRWVPVADAVALDALEMMVEQYLHMEDRPGEYCHAHMAAGEYACEVLAERRPEKWERTRIGVKRKS